LITTGKIVITGVGPLSSIGCGKIELWKSLIGGKTGLTTENYKLDKDNIEEYYLHKIHNFNINSFGVNEEILADIKAWKYQEDATDLYFMLASISLALVDSQLNSQRDGRKIGLVLFHENPGLDQFYQDIIQETYYLSKKSHSKTDYFKNICAKFMRRGYDLQTFMFLFQAARIFGIRGYSLFMNNACASGLYAMEAAADVIRSKKCDAVIVAGTDCGSVFKHLWFKELSMYPDDGKIKPFALNRDGFVLGDGGAALVMEDYDYAKERKAHIYSEYLGGGFSLEGWKVTVPNLSSTSYMEAILNSIDVSNIQKEDLDLIIPHGVGTKITDAYEAKAFTKVFGSNFTRPLVTALKPYIGHNLGSNALLEVVILMLILENNYIPPTLNSQYTDPALNIHVVKKSINTKLTTAMKTSCGFAGYNASCVFKKIEEVIA
jgi:3-oxoacyl-(acyl-carrier-protein) synthase